MSLQQYEVYIVNLDPTVGSEIKKSRPCVIISPNEMNDYLNTVIIAPVTSQFKDYPTRLKIMIENNLNSVVLDQIRTIDKSRIVKRISQLSKQEIIAVKLVLKEIFVD